MYIYILEFEQLTDGHCSQITYIKLSSGKKKKRIFIKNINENNKMNKSSFKKINLLISFEVNEVIRFNFYWHSQFQE